MECRDKHLEEHKSFCKAVAKELKESGLTSFGETLAKLKMSEIPVYKLALPEVIQAQLKKRLLFPYETKMLQYQRLCKVCFENDPNELNSCANCPHACFCKKHERNFIHASYCSSYTYSCRMDAYEAALLNETWKYYMELIPHQKKPFSLPKSMEEIVSKMFTSLKCYNDFKEFDLHVHFSENLFSRPLTLLFALEKLRKLPTVKMTVHVIGANYLAERNIEEWEVILHWMRDLLQLKIILVGSDLVIGKSNPTLCETCTSRKKVLNVEIYSGGYKDFTKDENFTVPHAIIGYDIRISCYAWWPESIRAIVKVGSPFIITSCTHDAAHKDHSEIHRILNKPVEFFLFKANPFVSLRPRVNILLENIYYANDYITIYENLAFDENHVFECCELAAELDHVCQNEETKKSSGNKNTFAPNSENIEQGDQEREVVHEVIQILNYLIFTPPF